MIDNTRKLEDGKRLRENAATSVLRHINLIRLKGDLHALVHAMKQDAYMRASTWQIRSLENTLADIERQLHNRKGHGHDQRN